LILKSTSPETRAAFAIAGYVGALRSSTVRVDSEPGASRYMAPEVNTITATLISIRPMQMSIGK